VAMKKIKTVKESEVERVSGAIRKFIIKKKSTEIEESGSEPSSSLRIEICTFFLYLSNFHHSSKLKS